MVKRKTKRKKKTGSGKKTLRFRRMVKGRPRWVEVTL